MRFRLRCDPGAATKLCSPIFSTFAVVSTFFATVSLLLNHGHLDQVSHLLQLADQRRMNVLHDLVLVMVQSDRLERRAHPPRVADAAPHLLDPNLTRFGK